MKGMVRKTERTDYVNFRTGRVNTGKAYHITFENGLEMFLPASWSKARVVEYVESQLGRVYLTKWAVLLSDRAKFA